METLEKVESVIKITDKAIAGAIGMTAIAVGLVTGLTTIVVFKLRRVERKINDTQMGIRSNNNLLHRMELEQQRNSGTLNGVLMGRNANSAEVEE